MIIIHVLIVNFGPDSRVELLLAGEHLNLMARALQKHLVDSLFRGDLGSHLGDHLLELVNLTVSLLPLTLLLLLLSYLSYLLFELHNKAVFGLHISLKRIKFLLRLLVNPLELIQSLLLLSELLLIPPVVLHHPLEIILNRLQLPLFLGQIRGDFSAIFFSTTKLSLKL